MHEVTIKEGDIVSHYKRNHLTDRDLKLSPNKYLYKIVGLAYNCTTEKETLQLYNRKRNNGCLPCAVQPLHALRKNDWRLLFNYSRRRKIPL